MIDPTEVLSFLPVVAYGVLSVLLGIKWIRVAQREHYIPGWVDTIARHWVSVRPLSRWPLFASVVLSSLGLALFGMWAVNAFVAVALVVTAWWPAGIGFRGRSSKLQWTVRARRLAAIWAVVWAVTTFIGMALVGPIGVAMFGLGVTVGGVFGGTVALSVAVVCVAILPARLAPLTMDIALYIAKPIEKALSKKWLVAAQKKLRQVKPTVVAVTGSYGKTSTKGYIAHLVGTKYSVVPSPASFNNLLGLARAVNDKLTPGTEVFVAEMGVYGEGEIRELSKSFPPDIAAITVIGEAHLERMKNRETILRAKSEIVENAKTVVLPIDDPDLAALADKCEAQGKRVVRVSATGAGADVSVDPVASTATIAGESVPVTISGVGHAVNLAVALGIAHALDVPLSTMASRLSSLPTAAHRAEPQQAPSGAIIIDDSYNANPSGAARAVEGGAALASERGGSFIVVTPGMIELGPVQAERNRAFAQQIESVGGELFVVGFTNRKALVSGHSSARVFAKRTDAMTEALQRAGATGVILVENDLPDHYA